MLKVSQSANFVICLALLTKLMIVLTMIIKELFRLLTIPVLGVYIQFHCMLTSLYTHIVMKQHYHLFGFHTVIRNMV